MVSGAEYFYSLAIIERVGRGSNYTENRFIRSGIMVYDASEYSQEPTKRHDDMIYALLVKHNFPKAEGRFLALNKL